MLFRIFKSSSEQCTRRYLFHYDILFSDALWCMYAQLFERILVFIYVVLKNVLYRSRKLILRSSKQTIRDLTRKKMIWWICTRSARVTWIGKKALQVCDAHEPYLKRLSLISRVNSRCRLFCSMLCSDPKFDSHRFKDILDEAIAAGKDINYILLTRVLGGHLL